MAEPVRDGASAPPARRGPHQAKATASEPHAAEAATALLSRGNAVDAVVAGVLAAAALSPGVLLGPVQMLFGGAGLGLRAVDGRTRQPGKGAPRPRGFKDGEPVAPPSRVGVPHLPAAMVAALASSGGATLAQVAAPAIALAKGVRKDFLKQLAQRGPSVLAEESFAGEIVAACGRVVGGLVTRDDLGDILPAIVPAPESAVGSRLAARMPWDPPAAGTGVPGDVHVVAACDHRGLVAVACYVAAIDGVPIEALDLVAPFTAAPVLRGQTRVKPGEPLAATAPITLVRPANEGAYEAALGIAGAPDGEGALASVLAAWADAAVPTGWSRTDGAAGALIGVVRSDGGAALLART